MLWVLCLKGFCLFLAGGLDVISRKERSGGLNCMTIAMLREERSP